jgi:phospholipase A1
MKKLYLIFLILPLVPGLALSAASLDSYQQCLVITMENADNSMTIGEVKKKCRQDTIVDPVRPDKSALEKRLVQEKAVEDNEFVITPYLPNYLLFAAYNTADVNATPFEEAFPDENVQLDNTEVKFQISFKFPVVKNLFHNNGDIYAAYTNRSFWQLYNKNSAPFRETNHQPEVWLRFYNDWEFLGFRNVINDIGIVHQSNGRSSGLSRSWNRVYARFVFERQNLAFAIQPWYRIREDADSDDNPDIEDYMGNFEVLSAYKLGNHTFSLMFRNNLESDRNRGAAQLDWSFPIHGHLRGYVQWFNGYGESLIDYNENVNSFGVGIKLTDWL